MESVLLTIEYTGGEVSEDTFATLEVTLKCIQRLIVDKNEPVDKITIEIK